MNRLYALLTLLIIITQSCEQIDNADQGKVWQVPKNHLRMSLAISLICLMIL